MELTKAVVEIKGVLTMSNARNDLVRKLISGKGGAPVSEIEWPDSSDSVTCAGAVQKKSSEVASSASSDTAREMAKWTKVLQQDEETTVSRTSSASTTTKDEGRRNLEKARGMRLDLMRKRMEVGGSEPSRDEKEMTDMIETLEAQVKAWKASENVSSKRLKSSDAGVKDSGSSPAAAPTSPKNPTEADYEVRSQAPKTPSEEPAKKEDEPMPRAEAEPVSTPIVPEVPMHGSIKRSTAAKGSSSASSTTELEEELEQEGMTEKEKEMLAW